MKRAWAAAALLALAGCGTQSGDSRAPDSAPTLPPAAAFKDGLLYAAVKARLAGNDIDSTTRVSVIVHDGVVTLRGRVKDAQTREREVKLVRGMRGITGVTDELEIGHVGPSAAQTLGDAALIAAVESALAAQTGINVAGIAVRASAGTVTLAGHAPTAAIRSTAVAAARKTPGVRNVVDRIAVR